MLEAAQGVKVAATTGGSWLHISSDEARSSVPVFSGVRSDGIPTKLCVCPSCSGPMFPVFTFDVKWLAAFLKRKCGHGDWLTLDVCPQCSHCLQNYAVVTDSAARVAHGGFVDSGGPALTIDTPFKSRHVELEPIAEAFWNDVVAQEKYHDRKLGGGVYHQLGGRQLRQNCRPLQTCLRCAGSVWYFGCIDSDSLNVPLYERGQPAALELGDLRCMNVFMCDACIALNYAICDP
jgi:hypothetical protein